MRCSTGGDPVTRRPRLLDFYACQGGAGRGYELAGFDVYAVDIDPQPRNPHPFHQGDALDVLRRLIRGEAVDFRHRDGRVERLTLSDFAAIHGSPPCQAFTLAQRIQGRAHPDLVDPTRQLFAVTGLPWVIENVEGAPLRHPVTLCGAMFPGELEVYRHRLFETSFPLAQPEHPEHVAPLRKMGRPPRDGEFMHVVGNFSGVARARDAMGGLDWMTRDGLREAIPSQYTQHIGEQLLAAVPVTPRPPARPRDTAGRGVTCSLVMCQVGGYAQASRPCSTSWRSSLCPSVPDSSQGSASG